MNDIYLSLNIRKSILDETDENGNYLFEVEASNENLDLQGQVVLQDALLNSQDHFLKYGVVSYDHLHKRIDNDTGKVIADPGMVIGEPVEVKTDGKKTIVKGKLYKNNKIAKDIIEKLKDGSTRIKASVGGIMPKIAKDARTGAEKIVSVLWNDLALTFSPVNATVDSAMFARSLSPLEFVKALTAGYGTGEKTGGTALVPENVGSKNRNIVYELLQKIENDEIGTEKEAIDWLINEGMTANESRLAVKEIAEYMEVLE